MTQGEAKRIKSLHLKKNRKEEGLFLVEGEKSILELIDSDFEIQKIYITHELLEKHKETLSSAKHLVELISVGEIAKMSSLEWNDTGIAVVKQKENHAFEITDTDIILALDDIRDPGNLGTIIRTADWYGVTKIVCSPTTAEFYNMKTISATMGSFTRVQIFYTELPDFLKQINLPIVGALLDGENAHTFSFPKNGVLLMGNESNGISDALLAIITDKVTIPKFGNAESLNVAIATGILLDSWRK
jgi:TrmH family RNA methyltransferase